MNELNSREKHGKHNRQQESFPGEVIRIVARFIRGQFLISLVMMVMYGVGLYWIEVPLWGLAAFLCGLCHWIPVLGVALAALIPLLLLMIVGGTFSQVLWTLLLILVVQLLESLYLTPRILGTELRLHPLLVLGGMIVGALLLGPLGAIFAAPLLAILMLVLKRVRS